MTTRTYDYDDRPFDPAKALSMSGLEFMQMLMRGEGPKPPIAETLDFNLVEVDKGRAVFEGTPGKFAYNPIGSVHGGWYATVLDSALGCAIHTSLPAGKIYTTVDLNVTFLRALTDRTGLVRCEAKVIHSGGSIATAEGRITDKDGKLYATGTTTCLIMTPR